MPGVMAFLFLPALAFIATAKKVFLNYSISLQAPAYISCRSTVF